MHLLCNVYLDRTQLHVCKLYMFKHESQVVGSISLLRRAVSLTVGFVGSGIEG